jgi:uncharacterized protein YegL
MQRLCTCVAVALLLTQAPLAAQTGPRLDVAFLLDATGSMADEIDAVKTRIQDMISQIALGDPAPQVRFGLVAYRDRGDQFITQAYDLTADIDQVIANLDQIRADGGGDYPESVNEALHAVLNDLHWDAAPEVGRLVFLIADAPPHLDYADDYDYREECRQAAARGIAIHTMGASGLDQAGEDVFRAVAQATGGKFQWLAYETRYVDQNGEEVVVVVEGRTATYTKGDSTWTSDAGFAVVDGGRGAVDMVSDGGPVPTVTGGAGETTTEPPASLTTKNNLADLITEAVRDAAEERGSGYTTGTAVAPASWGEVKQAGR